MRKRDGEVSASASRPIRASDGLGPGILPRSRGLAGRTGELRRSRNRCPGNRTGRLKRPRCRRAAAPHARGSRSCLTIPARTRRERAARRATRRGRTSWRSGSGSATRRRGDLEERALDSLIRQCLGGRRRGDLRAMREEIEAWSGDSNTRQRGVDWRMQVKDARCELKSVYPNSKV